MKPSQFIGREAEMNRLKGLLEKRSSSLIVVRGRRRIGKSRLLAEFGKEMKKKLVKATLLILLQSLLILLKLVMMLITNR